MLVYLDRRSPRLLTFQIRADFLKRQMAFPDSETGLPRTDYLPFSTERPVTVATFWGFDAFGEAVVRPAVLYTVGRRSATDADFCSARPPRSTPTTLRSRPSRVTRSWTSPLWCRQCIWSFTSMRVS